MNRRDFPGNSGRSLALAGLVGLSSKSLNRNLIGDVEPQDQPDRSKGRMLYRTLGKTGIRLPVVSMGVMNANNPALLKGAFEQGIRHFDTAYDQRFCQ